MRAPLALLVLAGCAAHRPPVPQAPRAQDVGVVSVLSTLEDRAVAPAPGALEERLEAALSARNLRPVDLPAAAWPEVFAARRTTDQRVDWLVEHTTPGEVLLLVETDVRFYSQMNGRFRWTVDVDATVVPRSDRDDALTVSFKVPVFLEFQHQQEDAAVEAAAPVVDRRVQALLDTWLAGL